MSCCNNGPTVIKVYPNAPPVCPETPEYLFENSNLSGQGVFESHTGTNVLFRGIASSGGTIDVTLDAVNNTVNIEIDDAIVAGNFPDSTTVIKGKTAYSTNAEALAKASTTKAVTPSNFAVMGASTSFAGFVELATQAETQLGTSTTLAVTPDGLKSVTDTMLVTAVAANSGARGAYDPSAAGQLLIQQDTGALYKATSNTIGDFDLAAVPLTGVADVEGLVLSTSFGFLNFGAAETNTTMTFTFETGIDLQGESVLRGITNLNVAGGFDLLINNVLVPANSVLITGAAAGDVSSALITAFLSSFNMSPSYGITDNLTLRTLEAASTLDDVRNVLSTLLIDLNSRLLPQLS